jgi:hypothetical protein
VFWRENELFWREKKIRFNLADFLAGDNDSSQNEIWRETLSPELERAAGQFNDVT